MSSSTHTFLTLRALFFIGPPVWSLLLAALLPRRLLALPVLLSVVHGALSSAAWWLLWRADRGGGDRLYPPAYWLAILALPVLPLLLAALRFWLGRPKRRPSSSSPHDPVPQGLHTLWQKTTTTFLLVTSLPFIAAAALIVLILAISLGSQVFQNYAERERIPRTLSAKVTDTNGLPLANVHLAFDQQSRRWIFLYGYPGPDYWVHKPKSVHSAADGSFSIEFQADRIVLTNVQTKGQSRPFVAIGNSVNIGWQDLTNYGVWHIQDKLQTQAHILVLP